MRINVKQMRLVAALSILVIGASPQAAWSQAAPAVATETPARDAASTPSPSTAPSPVLSSPALSSPSAPAVETPAPAPSASTVPLVGSATLPRDLSPWGMFVAADWVVKLVMIGLMIASVVTWTVWLAKSLEIVGARRRVRADLLALAQARSLADATARVQPGAPAAEFLQAVAIELGLSADALDGNGVKERTASRLERIEAAHGRRMLVGTGILATVGATAPFVGLFGTVWGIMNAFIGISKSHTTNLAVVAPGIAEALLATAFGLAAAIPAVVIYNMFARSIAGYRALVGDTSAEVMRLLSRDLDCRDAGILDRRTLMSNAAE